MEEYGKFVLQSSPRESETDSGYQPGVLAAAAIGFVGAGASPGGLSAAAGALIALAASLIVFVGLEFLSRSRHDDQLEIEAVLQAVGKKTGEESQASAKESGGRYFRYQLPSITSDPSHVWMHWDSPGDVTLYYALSLLEKSKLSVSQRAFLLRCMMRSGE